MNKVTKTLLLAGVLFFSNPAKTCDILTVWVFGDSNSEGLYTELLPIAQPDWTIVNQSQGDSDPQIGYFKAKSLLATQDKPDIALITYGAAEVLEDCHEDLKFDPKNLKTSISKILDMRRLFKKAGTVVIIGKSIGVNKRAKNLKPDEKKLLSCMDKGYKYIAKMTRKKGPKANFRLGSDPSLWASDGIHASLKGYRTIAKRAKRKIRKQDKKILAQLEKDKI